MALNTASQISNILFKGWNTHSWKDVLIAAAIICTMTIIFECLKALKLYVIQRGRKKSMKFDDENESNESGIEITSMSAELILTPLPTSVERVRRRKIMLYLVETALHMLNFFFGYIFMLLVMTYSVWFLLAIISGSGVGFFISHPIHEHMSSKLSFLKKNSTIHHSRDTGNDSFSINSSVTQEVLIL